MQCWGLGTQEKCACKYTVMSQYVMYLLAWVCNTIMNNTYMVHNVKILALHGVAYCLTTRTSMATCNVSNRFTVVFYSEFTMNAKVFSVCMSFPVTKMHIQPP